MSRRSPGPATEALAANTDYLFCPHCNTHVACRRVPSGGWEVQCDSCAGECSGCKCYLKRFCFGAREQFPPFEPEPERRPWPPPRRNQPSR